MTVCIAAKFVWNYGESDSDAPQYGGALVTAADKMLTSALGDFQFESPRSKWGLISDKAMMMGADEIAIHSQALRLAQRALIDDRSAAPEKAAEIYSSALISLKTTILESRYLAPYGLTMESFAQSDGRLPELITKNMADRIDSYCLPAEALVVGCANQDLVDIFHIDGNGVVNCLSDIGFAAIGSGSRHAESHYMARRYGWHQKLFAEALLDIYTAKKQSEFAPGVGTSTEFSLITANGIAPIHPRVIEKIEQLYQDGVTARDAYYKDASKEIDNVFGEIAQMSKNALSVPTPPPPAPSPDPLNGGA